MHGSLYTLFLKNDMSLKYAKVISDDFSSFSGTLSADDAFAFGISADAIGDFNADGIEDIIVGASRDASHGRVYIIDLQTDVIVMDEECDSGKRCTNDP